ncbi:hypothetical protein GBA52_023738 [Prunus armeniaca]|nr:hypothetical protein GBA52_023738 [Prunus armeniaca]
MQERESGKFSDRGPDRICSPVFIRVLLAYIYKPVFCVVKMPRDHNFATTCVCRVPKQQRQEKLIECVHSALWL